MTDETSKQLYKYPFKEFKVLAVSTKEALLFSETTGEELVLSIEDFDFLDKRLSPKDVVRIYEDKDAKVFYEVQLLNWWQEILKNFYILVTKGTKKAAINIKEKAENFDTEKMKQSAMDLKDKSVDFTHSALDKGNELKDSLADKLPQKDKMEEENTSETIDAVEESQSFPSESSQE